MEILEQKITLKNSCALIGMAKDIFSPLKEAITNSLDAITQRQAENEIFTPEISVSVHFKSSKNLLGEETHTLDCITIEDNGIGFNTLNLKRFKDFAENTKGLNNRGTGKIQIFCRFSEIYIDSSFNEDGKGHNLKAKWNLSGEYDESVSPDMEMPTAPKTIVKMSSFSGDEKEQDFYKRYLNNISDLRRDILKRFLLRLWLGATEHHLTLTIRTFSGSSKQDEFTFNQTNLPTPDKEEAIIIYTEQAEISWDKKDKDKITVEWKPVEPKSQLTIHRFKLAHTEMDENGIYVCSKNIVVEPFKFPAVRKNANFKGFRYLTSISGSVLDDPTNVNQSVDGFKFPSKKKIEADLKDGPTLFNQENKFVFWDEIKDKVGHGLSRAYSDVDGLKEEREKDIATLAKQYGIPLEDAEDAKIEFNDTEDEATEKLFETQAKRFAKQNIEIRKTYKELRDLKTLELDPTSEQYRKKFGELSNKLLATIPQQNKDELTRYIIRRDMVVELLKLALDNELAIQKEWAEKKAKGETTERVDKEGIIHDLIFKRRMKGTPNDLWILNEEFVHFDGCSEMPLNRLEVNGEKLLREDVDIEVSLEAIGIPIGSSLQWRPDIFLYPEEGKCVLVEFKAPDVEVSNHCDQIQKYAKIIANYSRKKFTHFYGFLIGEKINHLAVPDRYQPVPYGNYWVSPIGPINDIQTRLQIANIYQEIIPLSEIVKRAKLRNKSFAEKLGIDQNDLDAAVGVNHNAFDKSR